MSQRQVTLDVPEEFFNSAERIAHQSNRSVQEVLVETIGLLLGDVSSKIDPDELSMFTDDQLWLIAHRPFPAEKVERLEQLNAETELSAVEQKELSEIIQLNDRMILFRTIALKLLQERGHDIRRYFNG